MSQQLKRRLDRLEHTERNIIRCKVLAPGFVSTPTTKGKGDGGLEKGWMEFLFADVRRADGEVRRYEADDAWDELEVEDPRNDYFQIRGRWIRPTDENTEAWAALDRGEMPECHLFEDE